MNSENFYDCIAEQYDSYFQDVESKEQDLRVANHINHFKDFRVLDVGCGTGLLLEMFDIKHYTGIDPSQGMLDVLSNKFPNKHIECSTFEEYMGSASNYDVLISLYGSISYVQPYMFNLFDKWILKNKDYFFMFYTKGYDPITYEKACKNNKFNNLEEYDLVSGNCYIEGNYTIYTSLTL